jgi:hypothetical protein
MVAQGFLQQKGKDFNEMFAPVARMTSQRLVIAIASLEGLNLYTIDVDNAYLNGVIDTKLYMKQPKGFVEPQFSDTNVWVCELQKGLYGLKQAGNIWNAAIHSYIIEIGFTRTTSDLCVYTKRHNDLRMVIALHVDDFTVAATQEQFNWFTTALKKRFSIKHQVANQCLGLKIWKNADGGYSFNQQHYLETLLTEFNMEDCKPLATPMVKGEVDALLSDNNGAKLLDAQGHHNYRQLVGKLMYPMVGSRPDLAFSLSILGRYAAAPNTLHMALAKRVLAYVKGTINLSIHYKGSLTKGSTPTLLGYVDSDYANAEDRKSITGFCFYLSGNLISWCSKRQTTVATSTTVAEYFALYEATTETVCLRTILSDLSLLQKNPTVIKEDNQTAIRLSQDETSHKRTKHIDVKYHYTKEQQDVGNIYIQYIPSADNDADFFTKPLPRDVHQSFCKHLGLYI